MGCDIYVNVRDDIRILVGSPQKHAFLKVTSYNTNLGKSAMYRGYIFSTHTTLSITGVTPAEHFPFFAVHLSIFTVKFFPFLCLDTIHKRTQICFDTNRIPGYKSVTHEQFGLDQEKVFHTYRTVSYYSFNTRSRHTHF